MVQRARKERRRRMIKTAVSAYDRMSFPITWNDHTVLILTNYLYETDEGRMFVNLDLYCRDCEESEQVTGAADSLSETQIDMLKLIPLGHFFVTGCGEE